MKRGFPILPFGAGVFGVAMMGVAFTKQGQASQGALAVTGAVFGIWVFVAVGLLLVGGVVALILGMRKKKNGGGAPVDVGGPTPDIPPTSSAPDVPTGIVTGSVAAAPEDMPHAVSDHFDRAEVDSTRIDPVPDAGHEAQGGSISERLRGTPREPDAAPKRSIED